MERHAVEGEGEGQERGLRGEGSLWPRRSVCGVAFPVDDEAARRLARELLYRGSADVVVLGTEALEHLPSAVVGDSR